MPNELDRHNPDSAGDGAGVASIATIPDFLTVRELARVLRIGKNQAYTLVKTDQVVSYRFGATIRVPRTAIQRLLDAAPSATGGKA